MWVNIATTPGAKAPKRVSELRVKYGNEGKRLTDKQIEEIKSWGTLGDDF